ncbi:hypothetical protein M2480_003195 [Parabacteroides sp. PFB2-12]|uniref:vWA domain-containing protein n=1 Tax=unclassified Parabacteroides TaxID=2649774 RepID=UPI002475C9AC|nr:MULTISPECIES: vWA domain-containing protein [unclassified Parabacteroides]MDH6344294.1 hypothetical protein [Parabacteroides sp. PM6-13]MDH6392187.1 hypothetical protein [Parabacteroides sp. PFB2-12]
MFKLKYLAFLLLLTSEWVYGQSYQNEKRIYLLDVTASMVGKGEVKTPDIFENVKKELVNTINGIQSPHTEIVVIPFTNKPHEPIRGFIQARDSLINEIGKIEIKRGDTNIADAWKQGVQEIDSTKINYMFLLTDGLHNCGVEKEVLYEQLESWAGISEGKYLFAFYVMLTPNAKEMEIARIVDETNQMWLIESMDVNVTFVNSSINLTANVNQDSNVKVGFSSNNDKIFDDGLEFVISLEDNPYYKLNNFSIDRTLQFASFDLAELLPRMQIPLEYNLKLYIGYDKMKYPLCFFTPEVINFRILNKGVRTMNIREK